MAILKTFKGPPEEMNALIRLLVTMNAIRAAFPKITLRSINYIQKNGKGICVIKGVGEKAYINEVSGFRGEIRASGDVIYEDEENLSKFTMKVFLSDWMKKPEKKQELNNGKI
jgi:hypothetical protein